MNLQMTRRLACFQARIRILDSCSEAFTDLADMKEYRKLKADVEELVAAQRGRNGIPDDPFNWAMREVNEVERALTAARALQGECRKYGEELLNSGATFTLQTFEHAVQIFEDQIASLPSKLQQIEALFCPETRGTDGKLNAELIEFAQLAAPAAKLHQADQLSWCFFIKQQGPFWQQVEDHFANVRQTIQQLRQEYDTLCSQCALADEMVDAGNYLQAAEILDRCTNRVSVEQVETVQAKIVEWKQAVASYEKPMREEWVLKRQMSEGLPWNPFTLTRERNQRLTQIAALETWANLEFQKVNEYSTSDFKRVVLSILEKKRLDLAEMRAVPGAEIASRSYQIGGIAVGLLLCVGLCVYLFLRHNTILAIESDPSGVIVEVDGKSVGGTPVVIMGVGSGTHTVRLNQPLFVTTNLSVQVEFGGNAKAHIVMQALPVLNVKTDPPGVDVKVNGQHIGTTPLVRNDMEVGLLSLSLSHSDFITTNFTVHMGCNATTTVNSVMTALPIELRAKPRPYHSWTNTLGMIFVPVRGAGVLFSVWETRVKDYATYATANRGVDGRWNDSPMKNRSVDETHIDGVIGCYKEGDKNLHPVVNVSWHEAKAFCRWLTEKERAEGRLAVWQSYRLPTDAEWSIAVGLGAESGETPKEKEKGGDSSVYPWGREWPPPKTAVNYKWGPFEKTAPVGFFSPNQYGLFDMGGNADEWCEDLYGVKYDDGRLMNENRVLRGASWQDDDSYVMRSNYRRDSYPDSHYENHGFRCVLVVEPPSK